MSESHQREAAIFDAAMEMPPEQRAAHLDRACGGDAALRRRIESLLKACESKCEFLDSPTDPAAAAPTNVLPSSLEKAGDRIDRYKLLQQIGEGGCGVVYMAEQTEPVSRRVALKIIKLGMDTKSVIARFEAERQALALMDHPNIAKVLDAGATETGRPYFVMELVRGMKITEYCDEAKLSTNARLDLFIQVCQAIQHAHQKGIIHRDIKPSNILVTINDGVPVPKVIDFGVAKATGGLKLTNKTVFTAFEQFIGTPAYMSPEQAVLTSLDIDTRSDIYALGVLLYELLTGKTPFDAKELLAIGLDEMRRTIREQEPPRPSTRLSTLPGQELSTTAQRRGLEAPKLVSELRGDLDWIVMKALEKDRARRYETANGLAADIQRHLNNEPVVACPPGRLYRFQKLVRRNKLAFAAGSAVLASLAVGLTLSTLSFFRERAARQRADEHAAVAQAVNDFLQEDLLRQASSYSQAEAHFTPDPNLTVRAALDRAAERIGNRFKDRPLQEAAVRMAIGEALIGVGEAERAVAHLQRALELRRVKLRPNHPDTLTSMHKVGIAYFQAGKRDLALPLFEETLKLRKATLGQEHKDTLESMRSLGNIYRNVGKLAESLALTEETLKLTKSRLVPDDLLTLRAMNNLALSYQDMRKLDQAVPLFEETLKLAKAKLEAGHPYIPLAMHNLAQVYRDAGRLDEALSLCDEALKLRKASQGREHPETLGTMSLLGNLYAQADKFDHALPLLEEALKLIKLAPDNPEKLTTLNYLADAYHRAGKFEQALPLMEETLKLQKAKLGPENSITWMTMWNLALAYLRSGKPEQAITVREEMLKIAEAKHGPGHRNTLGPMGDLGIAYRAAGKFDQALSLLEKTVKLHKEKIGPDDPKTLRWMNELGLAYWYSGKLDQALLIFQEALPLNQKKLGPDNPSTLMALHNLAWVHFDVGRPDQALLLLEEKLKLIKAKGGPDDRDTLNEMSELARAYAKADRFDQALPLQEKALDLVKTKLGPQNRETLHSMENLAVFYDQAGKLDQALPLLEETVKLMKANLATNDSETLHAMRNLTVVYQEARKPDQALALCEETFKLREAKLGPDDPETLESMGDFVEFSLSAKNYAEAENWTRKLSTTLMQRKGPSPAAARALFSLGQNLLERQQWAKAEQVARDYLAICEKAQPPEGWDTFSARSLLGGALLGQHKVRDAQPLVVAGYDELKKQSQTRASLDNSAKDDLNAAMDRLKTLYDLCQDHPDSARWKAEIERVRRINDPGAIRHWLILAPIPLAPNQSPVTGLEQEQLSSEANLRPGPEDKASVGSRDFVWREYQLKDYVINFNTLLGEETPWSVAYAVCYVQVSTPRKGLILKVGSDDQARVYLNGQKIYENLRERALSLDEDTISNVELHAGLNVVVFKVVNGGSKWGGSLRFADKDDRPVQGINITLARD